MRSVNSDVNSDIRVHPSALPDPQVDTTAATGIRCSQWAITVHWDCHKFIYY